MGEYQAFPYLNHKVPEKPKAVYVEDKPLDFKGLYSPRQSDELQLIGSKSKNYWRTKDDVTYTFYEGRNLNVLLICCEDAKDPSKIYRTIVVSLEKLYFEVEAKARGSRDPLMKKKDKKIVDDASLWKGCIEFLINRLNFPADPQPWPSQNDSNAALPNPSGAIPVLTTALAAMSTTADSSAITSPPVNSQIANDSLLERMVTLDKSGTDQYDTLEVSVPFVQSLIGHRCLSSVDPRLIRLIPPAKVAAPEPVIVETQGNSHDKGSELATPTEKSTTAPSSTAALPSILPSPRSTSNTKNDGKAPSKSPVKASSLPVAASPAPAADASTQAASKSKPQGAPPPKAVNRKKVAPL